METKFVERRVSPALGDFALQERGKLLDENKRLRDALRECRTTSMDRYIVPIIDEALAERTA